MNNDKLLAIHVFDFDPKNNGGESLTLSTYIYSNGDPNGSYWNQTLTLQSYCNSASFNLCGTNLTPNMLRKLADELDEIIYKNHA